MINVIKHKGHSAKIVFDSDIDMFRGEIIGLSGYADFYADNVKDLKVEFEKSLEVYLAVCKEKNREPYKKYSGNMPYRTTKERHEEIEQAAAACGLSINKFIDESVSQRLAAM